MGVLRRSSCRSFPRALCALAALLAVAGCGEPPEAEFSVHSKVQELPRPARALIERSVLESFGTPQNLVAWLRLPVDYGTHAGQVTGVVDDPQNVFEAKWTEPSEEADGPKVDLRGLGLTWDRGRLMRAMAQSKKGESPIHFEVLDYDAPDRLLYVNAAMPDPPGIGDAFRVVGDTLRSGRRLYMQHCMHCHGVAGDGAGPTARYLNPLPRDYRLGLFKFRSTGGNDRPTRDDLHRIVRNGIPGTYMPSFLLMKDDELHEIVEYVRWLSMRGEYEQQLSTEYFNLYSPAEIEKRIGRKESRGEILAELEQKLKEEYEEGEETAAETVASAWVRCEDPKSVVVPKTPRTDPVADADSIKRGRELYLSAKAKCAQCHGPAGRGDGPQTTDYQKDKKGNEFPQPGLFDDWGQPSKPRDLTSGIYRGGRRPVDLYRRIYAGIYGTQMPPFGTALSEKEIWDLVNYVMSVPYGGKAVPALSREPEAADKPDVVGAR